MEFLARVTRERFFSRPSAEAPNIFPLPPSPSKLHPTCRARRSQRSLVLWCAILSRAVNRYCIICQVPRSKRRRVARARRASAYSAGSKRSRGGWKIPCFFTQMGGGSHISISYIRKIWHSISYISILHPLAGVWFRERSPGTFPEPPGTFPSARSAQKCVK